VQVRGAGRLHIAAESHHSQIVSNAVLGMLVFVLTEIMLFAGMISAFSIFKASAPLWPPPGQPRLPVGETALNTAALLASGAFVLLAWRTFQRNRAGALRPLGIGVFLGAFFVAFQGAEWLALIREGLTLTSSNLGSFFYLIVGMHALHAVVALGLLVYTWVLLRRGWLARSQLAATSIFWYFVVGIWPALYAVVYL